VLKYSFGLGWDWLGWDWLAWLVRRPLREVLRVGGLCGRAGGVLRDGDGRGGRGGGGRREERKRKGKGGTVSMIEKWVGRWW